MLEELTQQKNMGNIVVLDDLTINKIAAGEVIERPASVVKEMMENSIDAGASNISVEIKNGGISYIRITDNGKGIARDDMELAFERHATSKLRQASDLDFIQSMGFRGEALASIAAIAKVEMISRTAEQETGYRVVVEAGKVLEQEEVGCPVGTTITVENLFFNTPVRYKFLKKDYTESGYIEDTVTRLALVNTNIAFKLINSGKKIIQTAGDSNLQNVVYGIYGKDIASAVVPVDYMYEDIHITGVVGKPEIARSNRSNQLFFVNKRYIKDKALSGSVEQAFKGLLPIGKYGFLILNLDMAPNKVDVNVHPAKLEVRFQEEGKVFKAVYHAIKESLLQAELVANTEKETEDKQVENVTTPAIETQGNLEKAESQEKTRHGISGLFQKITKHKEDNEEEQGQEENLLEQLYENRKANGGKVILKDIEKNYQILNNAKNLDETFETKVVQIPVEEKEETEEQSVPEETIAIPIPEEKENKEEILQDKEKEEKPEIEEKEPMAGEVWSQIIQDQLQEEPNQEEVVRPKVEEKSFDQMYDTIFGTTRKKEKEEENIETIQAYEVMNKENKVSIFEEGEEFQVPNYKFIGIAFSTYIILEMNKELYILDQHAAHERIMYEKVKENFYKDEDKNSQMLLLPDVITLTHKEMDIARENIDIFEKAGFELEEFGENTIKLTGVPEICYDLDTKELFLETLDEINTVALTAKQEKEDKFIATVACKAAVKANMALTEEEVKSLMDKLLRLPNPFTCPHGRPTAIKMDKTDIEKKFARRK